MGSGGPAANIYGVTGDFFPKLRCKNTGLFKAFGFGCCVADCDVCEVVV
jgi:hypothetical protein